MPECLAGLRGSAGTCVTAEACGYCLTTAAASVPSTSGSPRTPPGACVTGTTWRLLALCGRAGASGREFRQTPPHGLERQKVSGNQALSRPRARTSATRVRCSRTDSDGSLVPALLTAPLRARGRHWWGFRETPTQVSCAEKFSETGARTRPRARKQDTLAVYQLPAPAWRFQRLQPHPRPFRPSWPS